MLINFYIVCFSNDDNINNNKVKVAQSCPTLCGPMDYTVHGILQARILEWVAFPFPRGSSQPRDQTQVSHIAGGFFTSWATREAQEFWSGQPIPSPVDFPNPGIEPGSPALQADSLPVELPLRNPWCPLACSHIALHVFFLSVSFCVLSSSYKDSSHWTQGPPHQGWSQDA